jgi:hypothetical protein
LQYGFEPQLWGRVLIFCCASAGEDGLVFNCIAKKGLKKSRAIVGPKSAASGSTPPSVAPRQPAYPRKQNPAQFSNRI